MNKFYATFSEHVFIDWTEYELMREKNTYLHYDGKLQYSFQAHNLHLSNHALAF